MKRDAIHNSARAVELFHALADQTRLEILDELRDGGCCVCELTDTLQARQSRRSFHLKVLDDKEKDIKPRYDKVKGQGCQPGAARREFRPSRLGKWA